MVFMLTLSMLMVGLFVLVMAFLLLLFIVFGTVIIAPFVFIGGVRRVFCGVRGIGESIKEKRSAGRVVGPREVYSKRLTDIKPKEVKKVEEIREVEKVNKVEAKKSSTPKDSSAPKEASNANLTNSEPKNKANGTKPSRKVNKGQGARKAKADRKPQGITAKFKNKKSSRKQSYGKGNQNRGRQGGKPQGITLNIPTTSSLSDYPDMV